MKKEAIIPNIIYATTRFDVLAEVVNKLDEVKESNILKQDFELLLIKYIMEQSGMVLVSFGENKEMNGCIVVSRQRDKRGEYLWIDLAWIDSHYPKLHIKFRDEIVETCKIRGIKRIQMRMKRGFKAMQKLYGVYEISKIVEKKVIQDE